jgi:anti-sigma factor RsiW
MAEVDHTAFEQDFSDYYDKALPPKRAEEVKEHLASCGRCKDEYEKFLDTMRSISGLHRMSAPQDFEKQVADTIHRRSAGRFFGRRAFGDRVPFELLALLGLAVGVALFLVVRYWR